MSNATKKLAGTFEAWRVTLVVEPQRLGEVVTKCKELGLQPKGSGFTFDNKIILVVVVPHSSGFEAFEDAVKPFDVGYKGVQDVELICPPAPEVEPCKTDGYLGICRICGGEYPVMGPFESKNKFLMVFHGTRFLVADEPCWGTARPPRGEVHRNYDGT